MNNKVFPVFTTEGLVLYYTLQCTTGSMLQRSFLFIWATFFSYPPHALGPRCHSPPQPPPFFFSSLTPSPPTPSLLAAPLGRLIASVPGGGGSCHISNLAFPPPDKSYIPLYFQPPLSRTSISIDLPPFFALLVKNLYSSIYKLTQFLPFLFLLIFLEFFN